MLTTDKKMEYYQALLDKNTGYEGVFTLLLPQLVYFAVQLALQENPNLSIVNFTKLLNKPFLLHLDLVNVVSHCLTPIRFQ